MIVNYQYVTIPNVAISHSVTPNDQTSEAEVNSRLKMDSIAIHFHGSLPRAFFTYTWSLSVIRDMPKSDIFSVLSSSTSTFRAAKSRCRIPRFAKYSCRMYS